LCGRKTNKQIKPKHKHHGGGNDEKITDMTPADSVTTTYHSYSFSGMAKCTTTTIGLSSSQVVNKFSGG